MDLSRLRSAIRASAGARLSPVPPRRELTYEPVGADGQPFETRTALPSTPGAAWVSTPHGQAVVIDYEFPPEFLHGRVAVEELGGWDTPALTVVGGRPLTGRPAGGSAATDASTAATGGDLSPMFFDLETTGLSGGAGTVPFLVGCGYFTGATFRTRQFFLQGFAAERALLHAITALLESVGLLVTYNGRTFDVPVMETRWLFHRMPVPLDDVPHLDMLPPSRRLWRHGGDAADRSCRLAVLEARLCGVERTGDVPGIEIPQRYFDYVRHGDARVLEPVLYHNRMDLLSLAALTARAQRLVREGADGAADAAECLSLGRLLEHRGDRVEAERCYRCAAGDGTATHGQREQARHALARLLRRSRRFDEAATVWQDVLAAGTARTPAVCEAIEALAVHHEHRVRDLKRARVLAVRALHAERGGPRRDAAAYRLARLERKLAAFEDRLQPSLIAGRGLEQAGDVE
jgi:hypothetical protein